MKTQSSSGSKIIELHSDYLLFDLLPHKKYHELSIKIPDTVLLEKGQIVQWLFNSVKHNDLILKKKKQNCTPLNICKAFCSKSGHSMAGLQSISDIKEQLIEIRKEKLLKDRHLFKEDEKVIEIITQNDEIFSMSLLEFIENASQNRYSEHLFFDAWKIIREKVNHSSKIEEQYNIENVRANHLIESKCHKVISVSTLQLNKVPSTELNGDQPLGENNYAKMVPPKDALVTETKNIEGYKFFDTHLNKKFAKNSQELIEFIEKNYKCIVEEVFTKFVINKSREPHLVAIQSLRVKPIKKISEQPDFSSHSDKGFLSIGEYMKYLSLYMTEHEKNAKPSLQTPLNRNLNKCKGDFCKIKMSKLPHLSKITSSIQLSPANGRKSTIKSSTKKKVLNDLVLAIRKRRIKVLEKLNTSGIIELSRQDVDQQGDSSEYESTDQEQHGNVGLKRTVKVCQNCYFLYMEVQKLYDFDLVQGNLIEKKESLQLMRIKAQSEKKILPPILTQNVDEKTAQFKSKQPVTERIKLQRSKTSRQPIRSLKALEQTERASRMMDSKSPSKRQKIQALKEQERKNRMQAKIRNKIKLDPLQPQKTNPSKGSRLLALSNSGEQQNSRHQKPIHRQKLNRIYQKANIEKKEKPKNANQAELILIKKLSLLPSESREQFLYFAKKYSSDNMPQQLDRKCFSSQYPANLYQFMSNTEVSLPIKNRIRKRPQISLKRLSELTEYPQIVSKSAFHFDTLITDEKTTIPFCVITTRMINGKSSANIQYENIVVVNDIFDSFIEHIVWVKDILQNATNKRVILFNYPGQSHTIYNDKVRMDVALLSDVLDKLLYRLSGEKDQLGMLSYHKDKFKFIGLGFGGYLLSQYLSSPLSQELFDQTKLSGVMLVNTCPNISSQMQEKFSALLELYTSDDPTAEAQSYLFYNKAVGSSETSQEDLEYKSGLNPIRLVGRSFLLNSLLELQKSEKNEHNSMNENFEHIDYCPVHIVYGRINSLFSKTEAQQFLKAEHTDVEKKLIEKRKFIELEGGHDLVADDYEGLEKYLELFVEV